MTKDTSAVPIWLSHTASPSAAQCLNVSSVRRFGLSVLGASHAAGRGARSLSGGGGAARAVPCRRLGGRCGSGLIAGNRRHERTSSSGGVLCTADPGLAMACSRAGGVAVGWTGRQAQLCGDSVSLSRRRPQLVSRLDGTNGDSLQCYFHHFSLPPAVAEPVL